MYGIANAPEETNNIGTILDREYNPSPVFPSRRCKVPE